MALGTPAPTGDTRKGGLVARRLDGAGNMVLLLKLASSQSYGQGPRNVASHLHP